ncbi:unnamed protein product [Boreogadus saida]
MAEQLESVSDALRDQHPNPGPNTDTNPGRNNNTTSGPADTHGARSRRKRFLSYPRYVELMVTADAKMVRHHGRNLEHYILTIMSVVAAVYRDPSVGNLINIVIVKLVIIHNEQEGPTVSFNAAQTLHNFCVWQQAQNVPDDSHPSHHDTALLITREDICRAKDKCDTLGLAELGTMCDPFRSCSISEENGLSASFTIAHELGHVFNMPHDDNPKCKEAGVKHQFHVMAPTLNYDTSPWFWSKCSRKYITEFLDTGYGECLLDEPTAKKYDMPTLLPGQLYNANKQCELMFGPGSQVCPYMIQCKRLWCTSAEGDHKGCRTQHMPPADGTECGDEMCSVSCGKGRQARYVSCRDAQGGVADESYCASLPRPPETSDCFSPCGQWRAGEWSTVSNPGQSQKEQSTLSPSEQDQATLSQSEQGQSTLSQSEQDQATLSQSEQDQGTLSL